MLPDPETCRRLAVDVAPRWVWFAGMLTVDQDRVLIVGPDGTPYRGCVDADLGCEPCLDALPDLTDTLTAAGALLVFKAVYDDAGAYVAPDGDDDDGWVAWAEIDGPGYGREGVGIGPTQLEALIAAILAAPEKS